MTNADKAREAWAKHRESCGKCARQDEAAQIRTILGKCFQGWLILTD